MLPPSKMVRVRSAGREWRRFCGREPRLQRKVNRWRHRAPIRNARYACIACSEDDPGAACRAFEPREHGKGSGSRQINQNVNTLCHGDRKLLACDGSDGMTVDCDHASV